MMSRDELITVVKELETILINKKVSPMDAENIAQLLQTDIEEMNKKKMSLYKSNGEFGKGIPL